MGATVLTLWRMFGEVRAATSLARGVPPDYERSAYANDLVTASSTASPLVRTVPAAANVVAVGVVAVAAVGAGRGCSDRSGAHRCRTDTVAAIGPTTIAVAPAAHC